MPGIPPNPAVISEIQRQMNVEFSASQGYLALAAWCDIQNYKGFAAYFSKQSMEERGHAQRFIDHLTDRGVLPVFSALPAPKSDFKALMEVARQAQLMEQNNTKGVHDAYDVALREKDYPAQVLLHWFITEQVEEENWVDEMVDRVDHANCAGGLIYLDRHIEKYLTDEGVTAVAKVE